MIPREDLTIVSMDQFNPLSSPRPSETEPQPSTMPGADATAEASAIKQFPDPEVIRTPDMWSLNFVGLYCQYAAVGLLYGTGGALIPFCVYTFEGPTNVCSNAKNITFFAWYVKIFFAILTDVYHPFGMRRRPWMLFGL